MRRRRNSLLGRAGATVANVSKAVDPRRWSSRSSRSPVDVDREHSGDARSSGNEARFRRSARIKRSDSFYMEASPESDDDCMILETPVEQLAPAIWRKDSDSLEARLSEWLKNYPEQVPGGRGRSVFVEEVNQIRVSNDDLHEAVIREDVSIARRLVACGASVNAPLRAVALGNPASEFMTLLHFLSMRAAPTTGPIVAEVILLKANIDARSSSGSTPLMFACRNRNLVAIEVLLLSGADELPVDDEGHSALWHGVSMGKAFSTPDAVFEAIVTLFARYGANLDEGGHVSPLAQAVMEDNLTATRALLDAGARPTCLREAVQWASAGIVRSLVVADADPSDEDDGGKALQRMAKARDDPGVLKMLRSRSKGAPQGFEREWR